MRWIGTLFGMMAACSGGDGGGKGSGDGGEDELECGVNAVAEDDACVCEGDYTWCDDGTDDCCAYDAQAFDFTLVSAAVLPYKDADDLEPWDWDGDVPDWLLDALYLIDDFYPEARTFAEVLEYVDEYAPELLEDTVPPDPYVELSQGESLLDTTLTDSDTYEPRWRQETRVRSGRQELDLWFMDEDLMFDDEITGVYFTSDDLAWCAGRGTLAFGPVGSLFEVVVEVEPVW